MDLGEVQVNGQRLFVLGAAGRTTLLAKVGADSLGMSISTIHTLVLLATKYPLILHQFSKSSSCVQ